MRYFPLFLDIAGKPVLLVGGGDVAARKYALLADAGAVVTVVAPVLKRELNAAFESGAITWLQRRNNVVGVVKRLPMDGLFHRDWTPRCMNTH